MGQSADNGHYGPCGGGAFFQEDGYGPAAGIWTESGHHHVRYYVRHGPRQFFPVLLCLWHRNSLGLRVCKDREGEIHHWVSYAVQPVGRCRYRGTVKGGPGTGRGAVDDPAD